MITARLVFTFTLFLLVLFVFFNILMQVQKQQELESVEDNTTTFWLRVVFALWLGGSGIWNAIVWLTVVVPLAERNGAVIRPWYYTSKVRFSIDFPSIFEFF